MLYVDILIRMENTKTPKKVGAINCFVPASQ